MDESSEHTLLLSVMRSRSSPKLLCGRWMQHPAHLLAPTSAVKYHIFLPVSPIPACAQEKKEAVLIAPLINAFGFVQPFMLFWFKLGGFGIHPVYVTQAAQDYMDLSS